MLPAYTNASQTSVIPPTYKHKAVALKDVIKGDIRVALNLLEKAERRTANLRPNLASNRNDFENLYYLHYFTGMMYLNGEGTDVDIKQAAFYCIKATALNNKIKPESNWEKQLNLFRFCMNAEPSTLDMEQIQEIITFIEENRKWINSPNRFEVRKFPQKEVFYLLFQLYEKLGNSVKASENCLKAIKSGHLDAGIWMGKNKTLPIEEWFSYFYTAAVYQGRNGITQLEKLFQSSLSDEKNATVLIHYQIKLAKLYFKHDEFDKGFQLFKQVADKNPASQGDIAPKLAKCILQYPTIADELDQSKVMGYLKAAADHEPPNCEAAFRYAELSIINDESQFVTEMKRHIQYGNLPYLQSHYGALKYLKITKTYGNIPLNRFKQLLFSVVNKAIKHKITNYYAQHLYLLCFADKTNPHCPFQKAAFESLKDALLEKQSLKNKLPPSKSGLVENCLFDIKNCSIEKSYMQNLPSNYWDDLSSCLTIFTKKIPDRFIDAFRTYILIKNNDLHINSKGFSKFGNTLANLEPDFCFMLGSQIKEEYPNEAMAFFKVAAEGVIPGAVKALLDLDMIDSSQMATQTTKKDSPTPISKKEKEEMLKRAVMLRNADADEIFYYAEILFERDMKKADSFWGIQKFESENWYTHQALSEHGLAKFRLMEIDLIQNKNKANQTKLGEAYFRGYYIPSKGALPVFLGKNTEKAIKYLGKDGYQKLEDASKIAHQTHPATPSEEKSITPTTEPIKSQSNFPATFEMPKEKSFWSDMGSAIIDTISPPPVIKGDLHSIDDDTSQQPVATKGNAVSQWLGEFFSTPSVKPYHNNDDGL